MKDSLFKDAREAIRSEVESSGDYVDVEAIYDKFPSEHPEIYKGLKVRYEDVKNWSWKTYVGRYIRTTLQWRCHPCALLRFDAYV